jgi:Deoxynucleoside kinases
VIVSIEGNIGSGKTRLLEGLRQSGHRVFDEPFEKNRYLEDFYKNPKEYAFKTQISFLSARKKQYNHANFSSRDQVVFVERTVYTDQFVFARMLYDTGMIDERDWQSYLDHFDISRTNYPELVVYIDVTPETCLERIKKRGREMEKSITLEYLANVDSYYRKNLNHMGCHKKFLTIDEGESGVKKIVDLVKDYRMDILY